MSDPTDIATKLADVQKRLLDLPDDAFAEKFELLKERDALRDMAAGYAETLDRNRSDEELRKELAALRSRAQSIEDQRIDLVVQAGSGGAISGEMGNLGGVKINKAIEDGHGLPKIRSRIGIIKGILNDRGAEFPHA
jgi:hypothetical protein